MTERENIVMQTFDTNSNYIVLLDYKDFEDYKGHNIKNFLKVTMSTASYLMKMDGQIDGYQICKQEYLEPKYEEDRTKSILYLAEKTAFDHIELSGEYDIYIDMKTYKTTDNKRFYTAKCVYYSWSRERFRIEFTTKIQSIILSLMEIQRIYMQDRCSTKMYMPDKIMDIDFKVKPAK